MITWLGFYICDTLISVVNQQVPLRGRLAWRVRKARISPLKQPLGQQAWRGAVGFASIVVLSENDSQRPSPKNKTSGCRRGAMHSLCGGQLQQQNWTGGMSLLPERPAWQELFE